MAPVLTSQCFPLPLLFSLSLYPLSLATTGAVSTAIKFQLMVACLSPSISILHSHLDISLLTYLMSVTTPDERKQMQEKLQNQSHNFNETSRRFGNLKGITIMDEPSKTREELNGLLPHQKQTYSIQVQRTISTLFI